MTPQAFIEKWRASTLKESAAYVEHFTDLCRLLGRPTPAEADPTGASFTFQKGVTKNLGSATSTIDTLFGVQPVRGVLAHGYADVWKRGCFAWEYKGKHKNLEKAREQLLQYLDDLENPPLLVVCDFERFEIHTRFNNCIKTVHSFTNEEIAQPETLQKLRALFDNPDFFKPTKTIEAITEDVANKFAILADSLRDRGVDSHAAAHFLMKVLFCLFAEDVGLLPNDIFTRMVQKALGRFQGHTSSTAKTGKSGIAVTGENVESDFFSKHLRQLFRAMKSGGEVLMENIDHFNGGLFEDDTVYEFTGADLEVLYYCTKQDWSSIEPSIFGTLFERSLDPAQRSQLGAHYTSRADIESMVEPILMQPLRREWTKVQEQATKIFQKRNASSGKGKEYASQDKQLRRLLEDFMHRLSLERVLDPSCGSGNFLYVSLNLLKELEKEVLTLAVKCGHTLFRFVGPEQLYGMEINPYAVELARLVVWIGHIQWDKSNGLYRPEQPILKPLKNIHEMDAILSMPAKEGGSATEPKWPECEVIVGNPPFLGGKKLREELGDAYMKMLFFIYKKRLPREADMCCYWFEKAWHMIEKRGCKRAGLLATQAIRGGANREILKKIIKKGRIFFAVSDRSWRVRSAHVHISLIGFEEKIKSVQVPVLNGQPVDKINSDLTSGLCDVTSARRITQNIGISFMGVTKVGPFDIKESLALNWLAQSTRNERPNSDVLLPFANGMDLTRRSSERWIINYGFDSKESHVKKYKAPFEYLCHNVRDKRKVKSWYRSQWWELYAPRPNMCEAIGPKARYLATPRVSKHRLFVWLDRVITPDCQLIVFARDDDYFLGVLHSRIHEVWARAQGTQVRERESGFRYTPTTCFETFPMPEPAKKQEAAVAQAAQELDALRNQWLNPPEWTHEDVLTFPASLDGPWARYVKNPNASGIGTAHYSRFVPNDASCAKKLARRTMTYLYNELPAWLAAAHKKLDETVCAAYGWPADISHEKILDHLSQLNLEREHANPPSAGEQRHVR